MVTKEEIREGLKELYCKNCLEGISERCEIRKRERPCEHASIQVDRNFIYLHSQGVVKKVDKVCLPPHLKELAYDDGEKVYDLKAIEYLIEGQRYPRASAKLWEQN